MTAMQHWQIMWMLISDYGVLKLKNFYLQTLLQKNRNRQNALIPSG